MTAEELWKRSGLDGEYEAWAFTDAPDKLADLVKRGIKTATCSSYDLCLAQNEKIPESGDYSIILDSTEEAVCIIRTTKVSIIPFAEVGEDQAFKEGEGDRSLAYWRTVHEEFLRHELNKINQEFTPETKVVCEEFELVYV